jgi:uncharacterized protein YidB (DUF937 family)
MHRRLFRAFLLILVSAVAWGCVTSNVTRLNDTERPPLRKEDVTIYLEEESIEGEYDEMAVINIEASANLTDESDVYKRAREDAAKIGANGVLFEKMEEAGTGERVAAALVGTGADTDAKMVAIYVENASEDRAAVDSIASGQ